MLAVLIIFLNTVVLVKGADNNIFGIHLAQPHFEDIEAAARLVNSNGGRWGYVTLIIQENDKGLNKWQGVFDKLRELKLIPIIRLATQPQGENWRRPDVQDVNEWVVFLNSLNWVVKDRYIILFNEPNHNNEWGGEVDEKSYTEIAYTFAKTLKEKNQDFFVMLAGFDASAPSSPPRYEDEEKFLRKIIEYRPDIFNFLDGWVSHSYPNPGFSGSPYDFGRRTVRTYDWELELLRSLGVNKELPVFITETGWQRSPFLTEEKIADYLRYTFENVWLKDWRIKAVTPFILNYQSEPFLGFSWKKYQENNFYSYYHRVQSLAKKSGGPEIINKGKIVFDLPKELIVQSLYNFKVSLKNQGQAIWDKADGYQLRIIAVDDNEELPIEVLFNDLKNIKPFEERTIEFSLKTINKQETSNFKFILEKDNEKILESDIWSFHILPLPSLKISLSFWPGVKAKSDDFELQIFDIDEKLVFKKKSIKVKNGLGNINEIQNISLGELYRVVILKPGFLPRQKYFVFKTKDNQVEFKKLLPFDTNKDGKFSLKDLLFFYRVFRLF